MNRKLVGGLLVALGHLALGCSSASYQVMQKGTWKVGIPEGKQPVAPNVLQTVSADAPGGKAVVVVVYFGADEPPIVEAKGDTSALVDATAAVGRKAFDLAVQAAKLAH